MNISPESQAMCDRLREDFGIKTVQDLGRVADARGMKPSELLAEATAS